MFNSFSRSVDEMSERAFVFVLGLLIAGGIGTSVFAGTLTASMQPRWYVAIGFFLLALVGVFLVHIDEVIVSLFGYGILCSAMGLMLGPFVARFSYAAVTKAALITLVVTLVISVAGALYPQSVSHWGGFLFTGLIVTIVASFGGIILSAFGIVGHVFFRALDWIVIFLFCGYIFYDMNMAMREEKTFLQAIQSAAAMFLNILNIFVRILDIAGDD